jgi:hypothetical protein
VLQIVAVLLVCLYVVAEVYRTRPIRARQREQRRSVQANIATFRDAGYRVIVSDNGRSYIALCAKFD